MHYCTLTGIVLLFAVQAYTSSDGQKLQIVTIATEETDGYKRFMRSVKTVGLDKQLTVFGLDKKGTRWDTVSTSGGIKINMLKKELEKYKDNRDTVLMFVDSYDVIFVDGADAIMEKFKKFGANVVFSAEGVLWPDTSLSNKYPSVTVGKRYLCSGGYMGYGADIYAMLNYKTIEDGDDDQLYFTHVYLDAELREKLKIKLDHVSEIFQNIYGAYDEVKLKFHDDKSYVENTEYGTNPIVLHGNGLSKFYVNFLGNYVPEMWSMSKGCLWCDEDLNKYHQLAESSWPTVTLALFIEKATPFMVEHLGLIQDQHYPKDRIDLFIHNVVKFHEPQIAEFIEKYGSQYRSIRIINAEEGVSEWLARNAALDHCVEKNCDFLFVVDSEAQLVNPQTIQLLIEQNLPILGPVLVRPGKLWSNFWGALTEENFYARSEDYVDIVEKRKIGVWNIALVHTCYMIRGDRVKEISPLKPYIYKLLDADMAFGEHMRQHHHFMYVTNRVHFGHMLNSEGFDTNRKSPDLYMIFENQLDWEEKYIHKWYSKALEDDTPIAELSPPGTTDFPKDKYILQPCPDVYWFPLTTDKFCDDLVEEVNGFGRWSSGTHEDKRLEGGYEAVPTRDIHMRQVGLQDHWLWFLKSYVMPIQRKLFLGYHDEPPQAIMNFVVRYKIDEQPSLRPHHDSSTYTLNLALNNYLQDYTGGGVRFIRYNCTLLHTRKGWSLMHPGKLTHYHEGLQIKDGIRYIMVSFVDP